MTQQRLRSAAVILSLAVVCGVSISFAALAGNDKEPPYLLSADDVKFEIVGASFVAKLQGLTNRFEENDLDKYRGLVVTVKITKPADEELTLVAQDLTLHYHFGESADVSRCQGISTFTKEKDVDRIMRFYNNVGSATTGTATTKLTTIYVDLFFQYMEPNTSDIHLFVARPADASYQTSGWDK